MARCITSAGVGSMPMPRLYCRHFVLDPQELGTLPLQSIAKGELSFQTINNEGKVVEMKRLPQPQERVVLREMEKQLKNAAFACVREINLCFRAIADEIAMLSGSVLQYS